MIEGARALPWIQEARKETPELLRCETCRESVEPAVRAAMGCGWTAPAEHVSVWRHQGDRGAEYTTCPGYTTMLPDVVDVARSYLHWDKGQLAIRVADPPSVLLDLIEVMHGAVCDQRAWIMTPPERR